MRKRDDRTRLLHMLEHAKEAVELARDMTREDLETPSRYSLAGDHRSKTQACLWLRRSRS